MQGRLLSVMHLEDIEGRHVNFRTRRHPLDAFLMCTVTAARSYAAQGWALTVLSDSPAVLWDRAHSLGLDRYPMPAIERYPFKLDVPAGIRFRGAHFKLEMIEAIARGEFGDACGVVDVDTAAIAPLHFDQLGDRQLTAYLLEGETSPGRDTEIADDIQRLTGVLPLTPRWYGGEFIYGSRTAFQHLVQPFRSAWERYRSDVSSFRYIGSEMVLNAVLQTTGSIEVVEARSHGHLVRWWSTRTGQDQVSLREAMRCSILHLPADKDFLCHWASRSFDPVAFVEEYRRYAARSIALGRLANGLRRLRGRRPRYLPRLS